MLELGLPLDSGSSTKVPVSSLELTAQQTLLQVGDASGTRAGWPMVSSTTDYLRPMVFS